VKWGEALTGLAAGARSPLGSEEVFSPVGKALPLSAAIGEPRAAPGADTGWEVAEVCVTAEVVAASTVTDTRLL
jgi:hypothetical protein